MADLGANSLWSDVSNKASSAENSVMGPAYSYADHVQTPSSLGVGTDGSFSQLGTNLGAVGTYVGNMVGTTGGNSYYVNTGGTCTAPDGSIRARFNFINNVGEGLIPGVVNDIVGLNPTYLFSAMLADSSPGCKCYRCPVTTGPAFQWLTPNLSPDFDPAKCQIVDGKNCPRAKTTESFSNDTLVPTLIAGISLCALLLLRR